MSFLDKLASLIVLVSSLLILILPVAIIAFPKGGLLVVLMLILSLVGLGLYRDKVVLERWERYFLLSFGTYFVIVALSVWWFDGDWHDLDTPSRLVLVLPIFLFTRKLSIGINWFIWSIVAASTIIGVNQLMLEFGSYGLYDFQDNTGIVTLYASIFGLSNFLFIHQDRSKILNLIFFSAALLGMVASLLSGGRGVWIAAFLSIIVILILNPMGWHSRIKSIIFAAFLSIVLIAYLVPQTRVENRIDLAFSGVSSWVEDGKSNTSSGSRLEMWKAAYEIIKSNPVIGVGEGKYAQHKQVLINQKKVNQYIGQFNHPHGEYISSLVEQGVVGFIAFLLVLLTPIKRAFHASKKKIRHNDRVPIIFTMVLVLHYTFYSFTSGVFDHQSTTLFYAVFIAISLGLIKSSLKAKS